MRLWYRDRMLKACSRSSSATLTFSFTLLRRVESDSVPNLGVTIAGSLLVRRRCSCSSSSSTASSTGCGRSPSRRSWPPGGGRRRRSSPQARRHRRGDAADASRRRASRRSSCAADAPGAIQALDGRGLVAGPSSTTACSCSRTRSATSSRRAPVIQVHGASPDAGAAERSLRGMVALGIERTIDQDPAFALRILVDIAIRALSPAVNDPTTAVQVLNHLEDLLH